jgi:hypothetical protein
MNQKMTINAERRHISPKSWKSPCAFEPGGRFRGCGLRAGERNNSMIYDGLFTMINNANTNVYLKEADKH